MLAVCITVNHGYVESLQFFKLNLPICMLYQPSAYGLVRFRHKEKDHVFGLKYSLLSPQTWLDIPNWVQWVIGPHAQWQRCVAFLRLSERAVCFQFSCILHTALVSSTPVNRFTLFKWINSMVVICHSELFYISAMLNSIVFVFACLYWCLRNYVFVVSRVEVLSVSLCC